jgi:hypothetical protein
MFDKINLSLLTKLALFHILIISLVNGLVTVPFQIYSLKLNMGVFLYPLIYITTDLTVRILGKEPARQAIKWTWIPSGIITFFELVYLAHDPLSVAVRVSIASSLAYLWPMWLDVSIFAWIRSKLSAWYAPPAISLAISVPAQTYFFYFSSFAYGENAYQAAHWLTIATNQLIVKGIIMSLMVLPLYGIMLLKLQQLILLKSQTDK